MIFLKLIAIPLLYTLSCILSGLRWGLIAIAWGFSLFTNNPVPSGMLECSYFIRGKKKSGYDTFIYSLNQNINKPIKNGNTGTPRKSPEIKGEKRISPEPNRFSKN
jgi:hypothetical protein